MSSRGRNLLLCAIFLPLLVSAMQQPLVPGLDDIINHPPQNLDDVARIIRGIEGGESLPGLLQPGMQKPKGDGEEQGQSNPAVPKPADGSKNRAQQQQQQEPIPLAHIPKPKPGALVEGFYQQSCPQAEKIVSEVINTNFQKDPTFAPALIRLFFHDCFITGCDASILLDRTPTGGPVEKEAPQNGKFVRGFEPLDEAKARLESECPGVVSCADLLAFANRDSLVFTGVPTYPVPAGRRDSRASLMKDAEDGLPFPETTSREMIRMFEVRDLTVEEMVVLIGAHSVGSAHCTVVAGRFRDPGKTAAIDRGYLMKMQVMTACVNETQELAFDPLTQQKMDSRFYKEMLKNRSLLESDQNLVNEPSANVIMRKYADDQKGWLEKFVAAVIKVGGLGVLTGDQGEIRRQCRVVN
ncbi:peroxidase 1 [Striga asiatica]|uniref:Peroxidase n=1 Tax=Striga asiatica TaxID=4170 RepID=A0A5A7RFS7_STRAF|nr:peroxidase 1 [Striga asiatica]